MSFYIGRLQKIHDIVLILVFSVMSFHFFAILCMTPKYGEIINQIRCINMKYASWDVIFSYYKWKNQREPGLVAVNLLQLRSCIELQQIESLSPTLLKFRRLC